MANLTGGIQAAFLVPVPTGVRHTSLFNLDHRCKAARRGIFNRVAVSRRARPRCSVMRGQSGVQYEEERGVFRNGDLISERYLVRGQLGRGSSGVTYDALDTANDDASVAIKALSLRGMRSWKTLELLQREARALQMLSHPAIPTYVDMFEVDTEADRVFVLVQRKASGASLQELVDGGFRFTTSQITSLFRQLLDVLNYLGTLTPRVLHRDVKPANIIVEMTNDTSASITLSLVDFGGVNSGVARVASGSGSESPNTSRGSFASTVVGTFGYMAPEQFAGKADVRSDLYAAAATILFALTGRAPSDFPQKRLKLDLDAYISRTQKIELGNVYTVMLKLLEPAPEDRFPNARSAIDRLNFRPSRNAPSARDASNMRSSNVGTGAFFRNTEGMDDDFADSGDEDIFSTTSATRKVRGLTPWSDEVVERKDNLRIQRRKPGGTRVVADRDNDNRMLRVLIPPQGLTAKTVSSGAFAVAWTGFVGLWTAGAITGGAPILFSLFSLPFWFVGAKMAKRTIDDFGSSAELVVSFGKDRDDPSVFSLRIAGTLGDVRIIDGNALDLRGIDVVTSSYVNGEPITALVLEEGVNKHRFGEDLDVVEQEWLCGEVNSFLDVMTPARR